MSIFHFIQNFKQMKLLISLIFIFLLTSVSYSQNIHFIKSYGNNGYDFGRDIKQDIDTGYIVTGSSSSFASGTADAFLLKVDSVGNFKWSYNYGGPGSEWGESVVTTSDQSYAIGGYTNSFGAGGFDFYLVKTDPLGVPEFEKTYGGSDWDKAYDIIQLSDSGYVLVGETYSFGAGNNDVYIVRTDKFGDTLWTRTYGGPEDDFANAVLLDNDSIVVVGGTTSFGQGMTDGMILKYHIDGTFGWVKTAGKERDDYFTSVFKKTNDELMISGTRHYYYDQTGYLGDFWIYHTENNGNLIADTSMTGGSHEIEIANDIIVNSQNHIIYGGSTKSFGYSTIDFKTDAFIGKLLSSYYQSSYINNFGVAGDENVFALENCYDLGFVAIGNTKFMSSGGNNIFILKVDKAVSTGNITVTTELTEDVITLGIEELSSEESFMIYPNPANNFINIETVDDEEFEILLYDSRGSLHKKLNNTKSIDISNFPPGSYILHYRTKENIIKKKIIIL